MNIPNHLKYTRSHEWVELLEDQRVRIGLTDYAQVSMGALVFVNLPEEGDEVLAGAGFAEVESVKAVSDVNSPMTGRVTAVNEELMDTPEKINEDPYGAWLIELTQAGDMEELLDAEGYAAYLKEGE